MFPVFKMGRGDNFDSSVKTSTGNGQVLAAAETLDWNSVRWRKARYVSIQLFIQERQ